MEEIKEIVLKYVLQNSIKFKGSPNSKAILGKVLGENPDLRKRPKEVMEEINKIIEEIKDMPLSKQEEMLNNIMPENNNGEEKKGRKKKKLQLKNVKDKVIMRFAPNPSGPLHIGHARACVLNDYFTKKYGGKLILRLEDTDPKRVLPEAYDMIMEDLDYLNIKIDETIVQSDRLEIYYKYGKKLIEMGYAYVCGCNPEDFKKLRDNGIPCKCRNQDIETNLELWERMINGDLDNVVVRLKTDIQHKNPSIRDFPIFRIEKTPHPRIGDKYTVYPLMNFSVPIDDHLLGMTHVLRGKDHIINTEKQKYIYNYFNWDMPEYIHYGILKIEGPVLSTSKMYEGIKKGIYLGWEDPRLGTLRALKKRGIRPEAIYKLMVDIGIKQSDVKFSWENLYAANKDIIDKVAKRFFFVKNPKKMIISNCENRTLRLRLHPDNEEMGYRVLNFNGEVYISDDVEINKMYRLMELFNVIVEEIKDNVVYATYHSDDFNECRKNRGKIIHWIPVENTVPTKIYQTDGSIDEGLSEKDFKNVNVDDIVQFERYGFVRVDEITDRGEYICYYGHK